MSGTTENYSVDKYLEEIFGTLGNYPPALTTMAENAEEAFKGYAKFRHEVYHGALPTQYVELLLVILDVVSNNLDGAKNHLNAAYKEGLKKEELVNALLAVIMVRGIAPWGLVGYKLLLDEEN